MPASTQVLTKPNKLNLLGESRLWWDISRMAFNTARRSVTSKSPVTGRNIILFPGFASDDRYMIPLRSFLRKKGYEVEGWGLGVNKAGIQYKAEIKDLGPTWDVDQDKEDRGEAAVPYLCDQATQRVRQRADELGKPITLIGWSLGGYVAREVARELPEEVEQVITMGAPVIGGPKYTTASSFFKKRGMDLDWIENEIEKRESRPITQPITNIFSKTDGVVGWHAALDHHSPNVEHIEVNAAHLGMGFNQNIWKVIVKSLEDFEG